MTANRVPGPIECTLSQDSIDSLTRQPISQRGVLGFEKNTDQDLESEKKEIILDITQFIFDITGIIDPTPLSDGTSALISLARGRWVDALISAVSIVPYIGDLAKLGKFPRYLNSIKEAVKIAKNDAKWGFVLRRLFVQLKKVIDQFFDLGANKLPDKVYKTLKQIKHEIDDFLSPSLKGGGGAGDTVLEKAREGALIQPSKKARTKVKKEENVVTNRGDDIITGEVKNIDPSDTYRDSQGRLRNKNGTFAKDPNTVKFNRSAAERRKALLRDAKNPNSGLSDRARKQILDSNGNKVPKGYEVSHEKPLYTGKSVEEKRALDRASNMKTQQKHKHRKRHMKCGDQFHDYPIN